MLGRASLTPTSYKAEQGKELEEENIIDAAIEDKEKQSYVASHNREKHMEESLAATNPITSVPETEREEEEDEYNPFIPFFFVTCSVILIKNLPSYDMLPAVYRQKRILPPKRKGDPEFTLVVISLFSHVQVLDLDETLVHCSMEKTQGADLVFPVMLSSPADWARFTMRISAITCTPTFVPFSFIF